MNDILEVLSRLGSATPRAIAEALGRPPASVRVTIHRLTQKGLLVRTADGTYRLAEEPVNICPKARIAASVNAGTNGGRGNNRTTQERSARLPSPPVGNGVLTPNVNETLTAAVNASPLAAFAAGFEDASGQEPEEELVLREVRRHLAEYGLSPFLEEVSERLASEFYLYGYWAGEESLSEASEASARQDKVEKLRQQVQELESALAAAEEENRRLAQRLEEARAEARQFREWAVTLYLRYNDLLDGNLQPQHLTDLVRKTLQNELAATARRLGID